MVLLVPLPRLVGVVVVVQAGEAEPLITETDEVVALVVVVVAAVVELPVIEEAEQDVLENNQRKQQYHVIGIALYHFHSMWIVLSSNKYQHDKIGIVPKRYDQIFLPSKKIMLKHFFF